MQTSTKILLDAIKGFSKTGSKEFGQIAEIAFAMTFCKSVDNNEVTLAEKNIAALCGKVSAVKCYKERTKQSLMDSKKAIEAACTEFAHESRYMPIAY